MLSPLDQEVKKQVGTEEAYQRCMKLAHLLLTKLEEGKTYDHSVRKSIKLLGKISPEESKAVCLILASSIVRLNSEKRLQEWKFEDTMEEQQKELDGLDFEPRDALIHPDGVTPSIELRPPKKH